MPPRLQALLAVIFWGLSFVATKAALREVSPPTLIAVRFALGVALLLALLARRGERLVPPRDAWGGLAVMGFAGAALVVTGGRPAGEVLALPSTRGDLLILASSLNWAVYTVLGHRLLKRLGALKATAGALTLGWLMILPWFAVRPSPSWASPAPGWATSSGTAPSSTWTPRRWRRCSTWSRW